MQDNPHAIDPPDHARFGRRHGRRAGARGIARSDRRRTTRARRSGWTWTRSRLDAAYDQNFYAPAAANIRRRCDDQQRAVRTRLGEPRREAYGPTEIEKLDIYRSQANQRADLCLHPWRRLARRPCQDSAIRPRCSSMPARISSRSTSSPIKEAGGDLRHDGRAGAARHRLGLQERRELRRRSESALRRRPLVGRTSVRRRAGDRLAEGFRPAGRHRSRAGCA